MRDRHGRSRRGNRGFTLLELGIVIGVAAILAAAIVPDVIETMRNKMAEKAAADVAIIHDTARLYFLQYTPTTGPGPGGPGRWPGENAVGQCNVPAFQPGSAKNQLAAGGYIKAIDEWPKNPWGNPYTMAVYAPNTLPLVGAPPACLFGVVTDLPHAVSEAFISFLPQAACNPLGASGPCTIDVGGGPPPAPPLPPLVRCCSFVPKPGATFITQPCPIGQRIRWQAGPSILTCAP
ncbi:MAG: prepilin-type N-terminal cleavage/methylation domain-containing protein [Myxococcaceae bacterium]